MSKTRIALAALAATCVMGLGVSSASAAITVGPGAGPWASSIDLPSDAFRFVHGGVSWPCGADLSGTLTSTGGYTVSSMAEDSCAGTFTFHTPFSSGQIYGSPGNYELRVPVSFTYSYLGTCDYSGTLEMPLVTGNPIRVGRVHASLQPSGLGCADMAIVGSYTLGNFLPLRGISGSL